MCIYIYTPHTHTYVYIYIYIYISIKRCVDPLGSKISRLHDYFILIWKWICGGGIGLTQILKHSIRNRYALTRANGSCPSCFYGKNSNELLACDVSDLCHLLECRGSAGKFHNTKLFSVLHNCGYEVGATLWIMSGNSHRQLVWVSMYVH